MKNETEYKEDIQDEFIEDVQDESDSGQEEESSETQEDSSEEEGSEEQPPREKFHFSLKQLIDGRLLDTELVNSNQWYVVMLTVIGIIYITIGYYSENLYKEKNKLEQEVKELRFESITTASHLMKMSLQSEVKKQIEQKGLSLKESKEPPIRIEK